MLTKAECSHATFFGPFDVLVILGNTIDIGYAIGEVAVQVVANIISYCESPPFVDLICEKLNQSPATALQVNDCNLFGELLCLTLAVLPFAVCEWANPVIAKY